MDPRRFDSLTRALAEPKTRRGLLATFGAFAAGALGAHVGRAQNGCPPGQTLNRKGECHCPPGTDACPDGCFDLRKDLANCGECGQGCFGGECRKGECRCPDGFLLCGDSCVDPASDEANCGRCGVACPVGAPGTCEGAPVCAEGVCGFAPALAGTVCRPAAGDCDVAETCDGVSLACPADKFADAGVVCRPSFSPCDLTEVCTGQSPVCPDDAVVPEGEQGGCLAGLACFGGSCAECGSDADCPTAPCAQALCIAGVCGLFAANEGESCGVGQVCLDGACVGNGACAVGAGCGTAPTPIPAGCPAESGCSCGLTTEGAAVCLDFGSGSCSTAIDCDSTADCPANSVCQDAGTVLCCGEGRRSVCVPLCTA
jgi:hypothetical protein